MHLRSAIQTQSALANGNYVGVASTLNTLTNNGATNGSLLGSVLRNSGKFPENFIRANPQVANSVMETSLGHANYHSLQTQVSLRPTAGVSTQLTYTWSRNLGMAPGEGPNGTGATFTDPTNQAADYTLQGTHRKHVVVNYGTFALPIGPQKMLFGRSSGAAGRLLENWQASWIVNLSSGAPLTVGAQSMLYGLGTPDIVGPFDGNDYTTGWANGAPSGNMFIGSNNQAKYSRVRDPQCTNPAYVAPSLQALNLCTLNAIRETSTGQVVLQTPLPGKRGTLGRNTIEGLGTWTADMAIEKRIQVRETKSFTVRVDARNIFNHPTPAIPGLFATTGGTSDLTLQGAAIAFGGFSTKAGNRSFQLKARVDF